MQVKVVAVALLVFLLWGTGASANNITVTNGVLTGQNTGSKYTMVQFDISWNNSWRVSTGPSNWDAAWVFVKYRVPVSNGGDGLWKTAWLNDTGHTAPSGSSLDIGLLTPGTAFNATTNPGLGAFIYNSSNSTGTFLKTGVQLRWNYGANFKTGSTPIGDNDMIDIQVFAIEMVYAPTGAFTVGSGGTEGSEGGGFTNGSWTSGATIALSISSENALTIGQSAGNLWGTSNTGQSTIGPAGVLAASFPKGYAAFYCMKYELSQQQYVDFLNTLTRSQQTSRVVTTITSGITSITNRYVMSNSATLANRNGIRCGATIPATDPVRFYCDFNGNGIGGESDDGLCIPSNLLFWPDLTAYLDWSGLRPMTELEFEKACRGTLAPVTNEYAWGTISYPLSLYTINNSGTNNEVIASNYATANCTWSTSITSGPLRSGIFAGTSGNTGRSTAGATYYGIMEMSGNLFENTVTVGNATGRAFIGTHGDGVLDSSGNADASTWPGADGVGAGFRGGGWGGGISNARISSRIYAAGTNVTTRNASYGARGIRTAP